MPLVDLSSVLKVTNQGILVLLNRNESIIWSSNTSRLVLNPVAKPFDSGNLVMKDANDDSPENFLWQSFDYPCDASLPGMKIGKNMVTGLDRTVTYCLGRAVMTLQKVIIRLDLIPVDFHNISSKRVLMTNFGLDHGMVSGLVVQI